MASLVAQTVKRLPVMQETRVQFLGWEESLEKEMAIHSRGLGRLLVASISNRDYPVALCIVVMIASVVVIMNYLADILTQMIDPRVRLS